MYDIFALPEITFPEGFLWGSATAAHQIEGDNDNNGFWRAEQQGQTEHLSGKACNSYELYIEDIELLKTLGHQAYRFSVEWSRIETSEGEFNAEATEHYVDMARRLAEAGIQPWITLHHFTDPIWFHDLGGWAKRENVDRFLRFVEYIVPKLAPYAAGWTPINEFNLTGGMPPQPEQLKSSAEIKLHYLLADAGAYDVIKAHSDAQAGSPIAYVYFWPERFFDRFDKTLADWADWVCHGYYYHAIRTGEFVMPYFDGGQYPQLKGKADFWAVNFYTRHMVSARQAGCEGPRYPQKYLPLIDKKFYHDEFCPDQLMASLERLTDKPVYITENGACCDDDRFRIAYMAMHYAAYRRAIDHGVDLRGLLHWSLMDNYEWGSFTPRFGLVSVDLETFERTPKPSAWFYKDIIANNGFSGETVRKHLPEMPSRAD